MIGCKYERIWGEQEDVLGYSKFKEKKERNGKKKNKKGNLSNRTRKQT